MSVRWSSCSSRARSRRSSVPSSLRRARASSSASRCMRSFSSFASRISSFWRARASASIRRASACAAFIDCEANIPRRTMPSTTPPIAAAIATAMTTGVSICTSRPARAPEVVVRFCGVARTGNGDIDRWAGRGAVTNAGLPGPAPPRSDAVEICSVAYYGAAARADAARRTMGARCTTDGSERARSVEVAIVGAGQAGLIVSRLLGEAGREHVLLERRSTLGGGWQDRWDAFRLVSPNWTTSVPGFDFRGADPDGFMPRDEIVDHFRSYAAAIAAPVELDTEVTRLEAVDDGATRFRLTTSRGRDRGAARRRCRRAVPGAVPAAGRVRLRSVDPTAPLPPLPQPGRPAARRRAARRQRPDRRPAGRGADGGGTAGHDGGRPLRAVPAALPRPRRFWWLRQLGTRGREVGTPLPTADGLPDAPAPLRLQPASVRTRRRPRHEPAEDGRRGAPARRSVRRRRGHDASGSPRTSARTCGSPTGSSRSGSAPDATRSPSAPARTSRRTSRSSSPSNRRRSPELDLAAEGISTVLWTSGYRAAFDWIEPDVLDANGLPVTDGGRTAVPGLSFIGTPWLVDMGSANLVGVARDAEALVSRLD